MSTTSRQTAQDILDAVGGPSNVNSFTHCATRLRFDLNDASIVNKEALDSHPGVMGAVPQGARNYQVIIGGNVSSVYDDIRSLPAMKGNGEPSNDDVKAAARAKSKGKIPGMDVFFEYLSDSFRPILGVLLGASLIIAFTAVLDALKLVDFRADDKAAGWVFVDAMWNAVFYFLPIMVAYNAGKKLRIDPWVPAVVMGALMTPAFTGLKDNAATTCITNATLGTEVCSVPIFGLDMTLPSYGGNVFVPLMMTAVAALIYKALQKVIPTSVHMVFVPFLTLLVVIPLTAFVIGPLGIWLGTGIGAGLAWMNSNAPFVFAIAIPMLFPFLVPLGLHWPLNALMLINIQTLGYDFIQGPMGAWNFACFGATAGVLFLSIRDKDLEMRQTSASALAAGLFGGISEPSLYGIHLRFKRVYPRMLVGCFAGGLTVAILGIPTDGVKTSAFAFTSLLTISVFSPMLTYAIAIAVAFFTSMILIVVTDYRTPEEREESRARIAAANAAANGDTAITTAPAAPEVSDNAPLAPVAGASSGATAAGATAAGGATALAERPVSTTVEVVTPVEGRVVALSDVDDAAFASETLGKGVGVVPANGTVVSPVSGVIASAMKSGHAYGIKTDDGVEILVHIGIDTVKMKGEGFTPKVAKRDRVEAGQVLAEFDLDAVRAAGYDNTVICTVTNTKKLDSVNPAAPGEVRLGDSVISVRT
ncbi:PTS mannose transporter subunit IIABC [Corynebacterium phocae]|uniref:PTS mannose transporter subunit IIABC n=1 Tax=Corynebacterium phocae TaxID=161895 RepID=A0A1L7D6T9_9CORY|nr:glucose PTS transporter subunit IIA [Corynebacterium phocae]APT93713.1 PTS mannose transporter subunit IIABC [Corynebacterium phocae]KAA8724163.1 PTS beta-glucoside transporter subunit EIIBCA [Corynebacterium phocae]